MAEDGAIIVSVKGDTADVQKKLNDLKAQMSEFAANAKANTAKVEQSMNSMAKNISSASKSISQIKSGLALFGISAGTILKGIADAWFAVDESTAKATQKATEYRNEVEKTISKNSQFVDKLKELSDLSQSNYLNADSIATANTLVQELTKSYGDLGIQVDGVTGKITGMSDAMKQIQGKDRERQKAAIENQISALKKQIKAKKDEIKQYDPQTFGGALWHNASLMHDDAAAYLGNALTGNYEAYNQAQRQKVVDEKDELADRLQELNAELERLNDNETLDDIAAGLEAAKKNAQEQEYLKNIMKTGSNAEKFAALGEEYNTTNEIFQNQILEAQKAGDTERASELMEQQRLYQQRHKERRDALTRHGESDLGYSADVASKQDAYIQALQSGDTTAIARAKQEYEQAENARLRTVAAASGSEVQKAQNAYDEKLAAYNASEGMSDIARSDLWNEVVEAERELISKRASYEQVALQAYKVEAVKEITGGNGSSNGTFNAFGIGSLMNNNIDKQQLDELRNISSLIQQSIDSDSGIFV